jgi:hypothetical protein
LLPAASAFSCVSRAKTAKKKQIHLQFKFFQEMDLFFFFRAELSKNKQNCALGLECSFAGCWGCLSGPLFPLSLRAMDRIAGSPCERILLSWVRFLPSGLVRSTAGPVPTPFSVASAVCCVTQFAALRI